MNKYLLCGVTSIYLTLNTLSIRADEPFQVQAPPLAPNAELKVDTPPSIAASRPALSWSSKSVLPTPSSLIAEQAAEALDQRFELGGEWPLEELAKYLTDEIGVPVWLDERAVSFAKIDAVKQMLLFDGNDAALRTSLHRVLHPIGLRAVIDDEGLIITADHLALVRKGIGTSKWVNVADSENGRIEAALNEPTAFSFSDTKLSAVVAELADHHKINILLDRKALEEIGLSDDVPITITMNGVKLKSALRYILKTLDLTYAIRDEALNITTNEASEANLAHRIYWLEGTGFHKGKIDEFMTVVQTTIVCDTWEALGGPSTMSPILSSIRPTISIATTQEVHEQIEDLIESLREANFGPDPILETVQVPAPQAPPAGAGFGGGGGIF